MTATDPSIELMRLINGYQVSQALHAAATLGVADQLKDGPKSYDTVAEACGAHPRSLYRLLRALAAVGVFHESGNKGFSLTPLVLLCHKFRYLFRAAQHGQRDSIVARAATNLRRIVAIEFGTWRSGRNGGSSGLVTFA
jgi:hypothetical protein